MNHDPTILQLAEYEVAAGFVNVATASSFSLHDQNVLAAGHDINVDRLVLVMTETLRRTGKSVIPDRSGLRRALEERDRDVRVTAAAAA